MAVDSTEKTIQEMGGRRSDSMSRSVGVGMLSVILSLAMKSYLPSSPETDFVAGVGFVGGIFMSLIGDLGWQYGEDKRLKRRISTTKVG